jgi:hypothetical protein
MEYGYALLFGAIATAIMSALLYGVGQAGGERMALVKGIGSAIPAPVGGSLTPGLVVHGAGGLFFALVYLWLGHAAGGLVPGQLLALGAGVGLLRGIATGLVLAALAFDQRPLEWMAQAGPGVGLVHTLAHVLYGLCVSALFGLLRVDALLSF